MGISKNQIDKLGARLKTGELSDDDRRVLDEYRRSYSEVEEFVKNRIREQLGLEPTGRAKTILSIAQKLKRQSTNLSRIQDIAGCRIIVPDIFDQERVVPLVAGLFDQVRLVDRRKNPSHGYRAVHIIATHDEKPVEIQVRTQLQQIWAQISEKWADYVGIELKYGVGHEALSNILNLLSSRFAQIEQAELTNHSLLELFDIAPDESQMTELISQLMENKTRLELARSEALEFCQQLIDITPKEIDEYDISSNI